MNTLKFVLCCLQVLAKCCLWSQTWWSLRGSWPQPVQIRPVIVFKIHIFAMYACTFSWSESIVWYRLSIIYTAALFTDVHLTCIVRGGELKGSLSRLCAARFGQARHSSASSATSQPLPSTQPFANCFQSKSQGGWWKLKVFKATCEPTVHPLMRQSAACVFKVLLFQQDCWDSGPQS